MGFFILFTVVTRFERNAASILPRLASPIASRAAAVALFRTALVTRPCLDRLGRFRALSLELSSVRSVPAATVDLQKIVVGLLGRVRCRLRNCCRDFLQHHVELLPFIDSCAHIFLVGDFPV